MTSTNVGTLPALSNPDAKVTKSKGETTSTKGETTSKGETKKKARNVSNKLTNLRRKVRFLLISTQCLLIVALLAQLLSLRAGLVNSIAEKTKRDLELNIYEYQVKTQQMMFGSLEYRSATSVMTQLVATNTTALRTSAAAVLQAHILNRRIELAMVVRSLDMTVVLGSDHPLQFDPNGIFTRYLTDVVASDPLGAGPLIVSMMVDKTVLQACSAPEWGVEIAGNDSHLNELPSWTSADQTLMRLVATPLVDSSNNTIGLFVLGDAITRRKSDYFDALIRRSGTGISAVLFKGSDGRWNNANSFMRVAGDNSDQFPDLSENEDVVNALNDLSPEIDELAFSASVAGVGFGLAAVDLPLPSSGGKDLPDLLSISGLRAVVVTGTSLEPVFRVVLTAVAWHVPFSILIIMLAFGAYWVAERKFVAPLETLIAATAQKKFDDFSKNIDALRANRSMIYILMSKIGITQLAMLALIFVNRHLIDSSFGEFTPAAAQGLIHLDILNTKRVQMQLGAGGMVLNPSIIAVASNSSSGMVDSVNAQLLAQVENRNIEMSFLLDMDSVVIASAFPDAVGLRFPEISVQDQFRHDINASLRTAVSVQVWSRDLLRQFVPESWVQNDPFEGQRADFHSDLEPSKSDAPIVIRFGCASVTSTSSGSAKHVAVLCMGDIINGKLAVTERVTRVLSGGYSGVYVWDHNKHRFRLISSSLLKSNGDIASDVAIREGSQELLLNGMMSDYLGTDGYIAHSISIGDDGELYAVSVTPMAPSEQVLMTYQVRGVSERSFQDMRTVQTWIQGGIMFFELLSSVFGSVMTYLPMARFLDTLDKTFFVQSSKWRKK